MRGDGRVYLRGQRWWIQLQLRGKQHREPARLPDRYGVLQPARDEKEAMRALLARRREIDGGRFVGGEPERITVGKLLDVWITYQANRALRSSLRALSGSAGRGAEQGVSGLPRQDGDVRSSSSLSSLDTRAIRAHARRSSRCV